MKIGRIEKEKRVVAFMVRLYCRRKEGNHKLCFGCNELIEYAKIRLDGCKFKDKKPACKNCTVHCYKPEMREKMRQVMRFSGPRMMFYAPKEFLRHIFKR
jgi:hypothetical protein